MCSAVKARPRADAPTVFSSWKELLGSRGQVCPKSFFGVPEFPCFCQPNYYQLEQRHPIPLALLSSRLALSCQEGSPQQALGHPILWTIFSITAVAFNVSHKTKQPLPAFLTRDRSCFQKAKQHFEGRGIRIKVEKARAPPELTTPGDQPTMLLLHDTHSSCHASHSSEALTGMLSRQPWDPLWLMLRWCKHKKRHTHTGPGIL